MEFLNKLLKLEGYKFLILIGSIVLILSIFANILIDKNGISATPRDNIIRPLYFISIAIILIGVILAFVSVWSKRNLNKSPNTSQNTDEFSESFNSVIPTFDALRTTQKTIIKEIYKHHVEEITCDDLFVIMNMKHPDAIKSNSELFYRILELENKKLVETKSIGDKTTVVKIPSQVQTLLETFNKLNS